MAIFFVGVGVSVDAGCIAAESGGLVVDGLVEISELLLNSLFQGAVLYEESHTELIEGFKSSSNTEPQESINI